MKNLQYAVVKQTAMQNPDGFTIDINNAEMVKTGFAVAYKETQDSFGDSGLMKVIEHAREHNNIVGGWYNSDNDKYYYDSIVIIDNKDDAINFGKNQEQIAIFDLLTMTEIKL